jgi:hypothetical protein
MKRFPISGWLTILAFAFVILYPFNLDWLLIVVVAGLAFQWRFGD